MKIARYLAHGQISYGAVEGDSVKELSASPFENYTITDHTHKLSEVKILAPCEPTKVLAIGLNYSSHLHDRPAPTVPTVFDQTPTPAIAPVDPTPRPTATHRLAPAAHLVAVATEPRTTATTWPPTTFRVPAGTASERAGPVSLVNGRVAATRLRGCRPRPGCRRGPV